MKLIQTGQWFWREGEISYKSFQLMKKEERLEHINFLSTLKKEELSTNDLTIIRIYKPVILEEKRITKFLEL
jgi:hypothetical protein